MGFNSGFKGLNTKPSGIVISYLRPNSIQMNLLHYINITDMRLHVSASYVVILRLFKYKT